MTDDPAELSRIMILRFGSIADEAKGWKAESGNEYTLFTGTLMKLWWHGLSALKIYEQPFTEDFPEHRDFASIQVIARAALESAGVFKYVFSAIHVDDKRFLLDYLELCGLMLRSGFNVEGEGNVKKQQSERERVQELQSVLPTHKLYGELPAKDQQRVLHGTWKPFDKSELSEILGMGEKGRQITYPYLSDYVHNGYVASLQISQPQESRKMAEASLMPIAMSLALTAQTLSELLVGVRRYLESNPDVRQAVAVYVAFSKR